MTPTEAETGAAQQHEFRLFRTTPEGHAELWAAQCWCGHVSDIYLTRPSARNAHTRHQEREWRNG